MNTLTGQHICIEAEVQLRAFIDGWLADGVPVAVDPYAELDTPPL